MRDQKGPVKDYDARPKVTVLQHRIRIFILAFVVGLEYLFLSFFFYSLFFLCKFTLQNPILFFILYFFRGLVK